MTLLGVDVETPGSCEVGFQKDPPFKHGWRRRFFCEGLRSLPSEGSHFPTFAISSWIAACSSFSVDSMRLFSGLCRGMLSWSQRARLSHAELRANPRPTLPFFLECEGASCQAQRRMQSCCIVSTLRAGWLFLRTWGWMIRGFCLDPPTITEPY